MSDRGGCLRCTPSAAAAVVVAVVVVVAMYNQVISLLFSEGFPALWLHDCAHESLSLVLGRSFMSLYSFMWVSVQTLEPAQP